MLTYLKNIICIKLLKMLKSTFSCIQQDSGMHHFDINYQISINYQENFFFEN